MAGGRIWMISNEKEQEGLGLDLGFGSESALLLLRIYIYFDWFAIINKSSLSFWFGICCSLFVQYMKKKLERKWHFCLLGIHTHTHANYWKENQATMIYYLRRSVSYYVLLSMKQDLILKRMIMLFIFKRKID